MYSHTVANQIYIYQRSHLLYVHMLSCISGIISMVNSQITNAYQYVSFKINLLSYIVGILRLPYSIIEYFFRLKKTLIKIM